MNQCLTLNNCYFFKDDSGKNCDVAQASEMAARSDLLSHGRSFPEVSAIDRGYLKAHDIKSPLG